MAATLFPRIECARLAAFLAVGLWSVDGLSSDVFPPGGWYRVEVRISLPNVMDVASPQIESLCLMEQDFRSAKAYSIKSENPLRRCELADLHHGEDVTTFTVACPGPNMGYAKARFERTALGFQGTFYMNMGGKNMTMTETQRATRMGDCVKQ